MFKRQLLNKCKMNPFLLVFCVSLLPKWALLNSCILKSVLRFRQLTWEGVRVRSDASNVRDIFLGIVLLKMEDSRSSVVYVSLLIRFLKTTSESLMNLAKELTMKQIFNITLERMITYWVMKYSMKKLRHLLE